jgi:hypothetical protein
MKAAGAFSVAFSFVVASGLWAQAISTSQINGTVQDASGLPIPGAEVRATQTDTGLTRSFTTNAEGGYVLANLPVGPYQLQVSKPGFSTYVQNGIVLQVNSTPEINITMKVGVVSEHVEVSASAAVVETQNTSVGNIIDSQRMVELPLDGRQSQELMLTAGSAVNLGQLVLVNGSKRNYPGLQISVAGGSLLGVLYVMDGAEHNNVEANAPLPIPFPDALQEFKLETSSMPARYGHHSAAAVNMVTRSGANDLHGSVFEFLRNGDLNARNTFAARRDTLKRNQFGGVVGGRIIRNKLFYFFGYQGTILRTDPQTNVTTIPTPAEIAGDFTAYASPACNGNRQINLGAPFVNNQLAPSLINPITAKIASYFPATTSPCGQITFGYPQRSQEKQILGRVDFQKSDKHTLFARYFTGRFIWDLPVSSLAQNQSILAGQATGQRSFADTGLIGDTYLISPTTISTFRLSLQYIPNNQLAPTFISPAQAGINMYAINSLPFFGVNVTGGWAFGNAGQTALREPQAVVQASEDIDLTRGSHQIAFGVNAERINYNYTSPRGENGEFLFNGTRTGLGYADFFAGFPATLTQGYGSRLYTRQTVVGLFVQDSWKVSRRLNVNLGVRWEPFLPANTEQGHQFIERFDAANFYSNVHSSVYLNAPAGLYFPGDKNWNTGHAITSRNWNQFAPRVGVVFDPRGDGKQVIRAGYGIYYDVPTMSFQIDSTNNAPYGGRAQINNPNLANPWATYPGGDPFPFTLGPNVGFPTNGYYAIWDQHLPTMYVQQWNLSFQRQFGQDWSVTVAYLGNKTTHQWLMNDQNTALYIPGTSCVLNGQTYTPCSTSGNIPQRRIFSLTNPAQGQFYGALQTAEPVGNASYQGLVTTVNKRLSRNTTVLVTYTWSHCISIAEQSTINNNFSAQDPFNFHNSRGDCNQDIRHIFNGSFVISSPNFKKPLVRKLAGNWQLAPILRFNSALPINPLSGRDNALNGMTNITGGGATQRPNLIGDPTPAVQDLAHWFNTAAYAPNGPGQYGNAGRNSLRGAKQIIVNVAVSRRFAITERQGLEVRAESFNLPNLVNPTADASTGTITSPLFGKITSAGDPRIMQFALKYIF